MSPRPFDFRLLALVAWGIYAAYFHARMARGVRGRFCAWLLVAGLAKRRANPPDGLANGLGGLGGLGCLIHRAVVDVRQGRLKLG